MRCVGGKHSFCLAHRDRDKSSSLERKVAAVQYNDSGETERNEREREKENKYRKMVEVRWRAKIK